MTGDEVLLALRRSLCDLTARHFINEYDMEGEVDREGGLGSRESGLGAREGVLGAAATAAFNIHNTASTTTATTNTATTSTATATTITTTTTTTAATARVARKENQHHSPVYQHQPEEIKRNTIAMELLCTDR